METETKEVATNFEHIIHEIKPFIDLNSNKIQNVNIPNDSIIEQKQLDLLWKTFTTYFEKTLSMDVNDNSYWLPDMNVCLFLKDKTNISLHYFNKLSDLGKSLIVCKHGHHGINYCSFLELHNIERKIVCREHLPNYKMYVIVGWKIKQPFEHDIMSYGFIFYNNYMESIMYHPYNSSVLYPMKWENNTGKNYIYFKYLYGFSGPSICFVEYYKEEKANMIPSVVYIDSMYKNFVILITGKVVKMPIF